MISNLNQLDKTKFPRLSVFRVTGKPDDWEVMQNLFKKVGIEIKYLSMVSYINVLNSGLGFIGS
jgi:hypothetical protein